MAKRRYGAKFKFQVVMELPCGQKEIGQMAWAYGVRPIKLGSWKRQMLEHGPELFGDRDTVR